MATIPTFTDTQVKAIYRALDAYAMAHGVTSRDLQESRAQLGTGSALRKHITRVCQALKVRRYLDIPVNTQNVLEAARATSAAMAHLCQNWDRLDRRVWQVVKEAAAIGEA